MEEGHWQPGKGDMRYHHRWFRGRLVTPTPCCCECDTDTDRRYLYYLHRLAH
jgi:hypothetical protein